MQRIKIPFGGVTPEQLEVLAELAEEYSDASCTSPPARTSSSTSSTSTTRPTCMRRLAAVGITTREACGNAVRNVTACPLAGVCHTEAFDVTPYARRARPLPARPPRHARTSGASSRSPSPAARGEACGLVKMHDLGAIAAHDAWSTASSGAASSSTSAAASARCPHQAKLLYEDFLPEEELLPTVAGDRPRVRAPRREGEPQPRAHQVPGREARHRGVPPAGAGGARDPAARPALDRVPRRRCSAIDETPAAPGRARCNGAAAARGLRRVARDQRLPRSASRATSSRPSTLPLGDLTVDADARSWPTSPAVRRRHGAHHRRAEHRAALGARGRPAGALRRAGRRSASADARRRHDRRRHRLPRHRHLQARHLVVARPGRRAAHAAGARQASTLDEAVQRPAHQGERLLQLLRPAPRRRHRLLRQQPQDRRLHRAALPGGARRPVARERRLVRPGHRRGAVEAHPRGGRRDHRRASSPSAQGDESFQDFIARIGKKELRRADRRPARRCPAYDEDPTLLHRLGRPARVHDRRHGHRRVRRRGHLAHRPRARRRRERRLRGAGRARGRRPRPRRRARLRGDGRRAPRALVRTEYPNVRRRRRRRSCASSASASTTPSSSSTASPRAASPVRCSTATRRAPESHEAEATRELVEEAQLFIDAVHAFEIREAGAQSALV